MPDDVPTFSATEFKAKCLEILDQLGEHRLTRVRVTKRGRVVAVLTPLADEEAAVRGLHGFLRGSVVVPEGVDLTTPGTGRSSLRRQRTRDAKIRAYAEAGHVRVTPC
jgi:antitoxin (DNA-binding transcriptional repressor) of toxin-antitoxin stability system